MENQQKIHLSVPVYDSFRVQSVGGMFDVSIAKKAETVIDFENPPVEETDWKIGLIVGPSGSGKSSVAAKLFGEQVFRSAIWPKNAAVIDGFGESHSVKNIVEMLTLVGFSSPPAWIKPYHVLSNGERFRCDLARALLDTSGDTIVFDEFTSVVDRNVAKMGSAALAKGIRKNRIAKRFVAVSCHYDIAEWLEPDWILDMATGSMSRRLLRRPKIDLKIVKTTRSLWPLFARHHYLNGDLANSAQCYAALWNGEPVAFCAFLHLAGFVGRKRVSRIVTLPDYQGVGIGGALLAGVGEICRWNGHRLNITTGHPAMIAHCKNSKFWRTIAVQKTGATGKQFGKTSLGSFGRAVVSFEFTPQ